VELDEKVDALCAAFECFRKEATNPKRVVPPRNGTRKIVLGVAAAVAVAAVTGGASLFWKYGGRITAVEEKQAATADRVTELKADVSDAIKELRDDVGDIGSKVDQVLGETRAGRR